MNNTRTCNHGDSPAGCRSCRAALDESLKKIKHDPNKKLARIKAHEAVKRQRGKK